MKSNMPIKAAIQPKYRLPTLQLSVIRPNDTKDTVWYTMNDEKVMKDIDFSNFEEAFKLNSAPMKKIGDTLDGTAKGPKMPKLETLLDNTRLKNVAICKRRLTVPLDEMIVAINALDNSAVNIDITELLQRIVPSPEEVKLYTEYQFHKKDLMKLTEEDRLMARLSRVQRLATKLDIMAFMSTFYEHLHAVRPRIEAIILASKSTRQAKKFKKILEIILAFGNYMNSSKKGSTYGFKLQSLDSLAITKSSDKKSTIVHYIAEIVNKDYPDLKNFHSELKYIDKAAQFSLENIMTDVNELERGMVLTRKELTARESDPGQARKQAQNLALKDFVDNASEQLKKLATDAAQAKTAFNDLAEFYGEDMKTCDTNIFFPILVRFTGMWKNAEAENEKRKKLEKARLLQANNNVENNVVTKNAANNKKTQAALLNELSARQKQPSRKPKCDPTEVKDGTLEELIMGMKSEPYRANDAMRKSVRRNTDRLMSNSTNSRTYDEDF